MNELGKQLKEVFLCARVCVHLGVHVQEMALHKDDVLSCITCI